MAKIWNMDLIETSDHIQIKIEMMNPSQELPESSKAQNQDFKDMDVFCTFKKHREHESNKDQWPYSSQDLHDIPQSGTLSAL